MLLVLAWQQFRYPRGGRVLGTTEHADARYRDLDLWPTPVLAAAILAVQQDALRAMDAAVPAFAAAIEAVADRMRAGGRMVYAGAGSSGLLAQLDALELPGTFGIEPSRVPVILAGGAAALHTIPAEAEDDEAAAEAAVDQLAIGPADALVALAASGRTAFTVAAATRARRRGALTVGIACVAGSPLLAACDHPILASTPAEVIAGSTRMGAGTAQKCALNTLSTGVAVRLGRTYAGLMVEMRPDNDKLRGRAVGIVAAAAAVEPEAARRALVAADWSIKTAVLCCRAGLDAAAARTRLARSAGGLRAALAEAPA